MSISAIKADHYHSCDGLSDVSESIHELTDCCQIYDLVANPQYTGGAQEDSCYPQDFVYYSSMALGFYYFDLLRAMTATCRHTKEHTYSVQPGQASRPPATSDGRDM